jgi:hypothetical protein
MQQKKTIERKKSFNFNVSSPQRNIMDILLGLEPVIPVKVNR